MKKIFFKMKRNKCLIWRLFISIILSVSLLLLSRYMSTKLNNLLIFISIFWGAIFHVVYPYVRYSFKKKYLFKTIKYNLINISIIGAKF